MRHGVYCIDTAEQIELYFPAQRRYSVYLLVLSYSVIMEFGYVQISGYRTSLWNLVANFELSQFLPRTVLFLALSVTFSFVCEISREPLNGFAPNSHGRRVWSLTRTSLKVKVKVNFGGLRTVCV